MTDRDATAEAVRLMLAELEATVKRENSLRRQLRAEELARRKLGTALYAALSTLPAAQAERLRPRLDGAIHALPLIDGRRAKYQLQAVMEYLAANSAAVIKVADVTTHLERAGFRSLAHGYASDTLKRLERQGLLIRVRYARYRVNEEHPEILSLHLRTLEAEAGFRPPKEPTRARDEAPRFPSDTPPDDRLKREIAANWEKIRSHPMWREGD